MYGLTPEGAMKRERSFRPAIPPPKRRRGRQITNTSPASSPDMSTLPPIRAPTLKEISEALTTNGPSYFLALPPELRRMIFQQIYGSITVYVRSLPLEDTDLTSRSVLEWNNPCPELLRVSHQVRDEALEVVLQNCVLDLWGGNNHHRMAFSYLPKATSQIKHIAITFDRLFDVSPDKASLPSLEVLFVDSINESSSDIIRNCYRLIRSTRRPYAPDKYDGLKSYNTIRDLLAPSLQEGRKKKLKIFLRCTTWDEDTILLITDHHQKPEVWEELVVPKFEYKFSQKVREMAAKAKSEGAVSK